MVEFACKGVKRRRKTGTVIGKDEKKDGIYNVMLSSGDIYAKYGISSHPNSHYYNDLECKEEEKQESNIDIKSTEKKIKEMIKDTNGSHWNIYGSS